MATQATTQSRDRSSNFEILKIVSKTILVFKNSNSQYKFFLFQAKNPFEMTNFIKKYQTLNHEKQITYTITYSND